MSAIMIHIPTGANYPCPRCGSTDTQPSWHAERHRVWFDCCCPDGHIFQVSMPPEVA